MSENIRAKRHELSKMDRTFHTNVGICFEKDRDPADIPHWHDCYEIEYVLKGTVVEHINDYPYLGIPGALFLLTPNDFHHLTDAKNNTIYNIMFPEDIIGEHFLPQLESKALNRNLFVRLSEEERVAVEFLLATIERELNEQKANHTDIVHALINVMIAIILREGSRQDDVPPVALWQSKRQTLLFSFGVVFLIKRSDPYEQAEHPECTHLFGH